MPTPSRPPRLSPCLPAMRSPDPGCPTRRWTPPQQTCTLALSARDLVEVVQLGTRYAVAVRLAPAGRPTGQVDDLDERLVHAARFLTYRAALRLQARVARAGRLDVAHWLWEPREHGRLVAPPVATPYDVER